MVDVVVGREETHVRPQQRPERAAPALVWAADAARVDEPRLSHQPVELHVCVPADHDGSATAGLPNERVGRGRREDLLVAPRRAVAEDDLAESIDIQLDGRRPSSERPTVVLVETPRRPTGELSVGVSAHEHDPVTELVQPLNALAREGSRGHVAA